MDTINNIFDLQLMAGCCPEIRRAGKGVVRDVSYPLRDMDVLSSTIREEASHLVDADSEKSKE